MSNNQQKSFNKTKSQHFLERKLLPGCFRTDDTLLDLTLFDMGFFEPSVMRGGGGHEGPHHNFVVIASMIMKFGTSVKLDVF